MVPSLPDSPHFEALVRGEPGVDLTLVALEIARDANPALDADGCLAQIAALAGRARARLGTAPEAWMTLEAINAVLFQEEGFRGNARDYYNPANSYLDQVLARKVGIPISLAALYLAVARHLDLELGGVGLPGHFVLRTLSDDDAIFIDVFHQGRFLDRAACEALVANVMHQRVELAPELLQPMSTAAIVERMLHNLRNVHLEAHRMAGAIPVLHRLARLRPDEPEQLRALGVACFYAHRQEEAVRYLSEYLRLAPESEDTEAVRRLLGARDG